MALTIEELVAEAVSAGAQIVGEKYIDIPSYGGGYSENVLDYKPHSTLMRKYLVLELPPEGEWDPYREEEG